MAKEDKDKSMLALVSGSTALSTTVHLTEEHLIKSAIAVEEEVLSQKLKETRKLLETLEVENRALSKQRLKFFEDYATKNQEKDIKAAEKALESIGFNIGDKRDGSQIKFRVCENSDKNFIVTKVAVVMHGYDVGSFKEKTLEYPSQLIKIDKQLEENDKKEKKAQLTIDYILEERGDVAKKERRAIAALTMKHLGGENTEEGKAFKASMEQVRNELLKKLEEID